MALNFILEETLTLLWGSLVTISICLFFILTSPLILLRFILGRIFSVNFVSPQGNIFADDILSSTKAPRNSIVVNCIAEGDLSVEECQTLFRDNMVFARDKQSGKFMYPEFHQYLEKFCGFCCWKDDPHFDIRNHVIEYKLNGVSSKTVTPNDLCGISENLLNKRFVANRSPWDISIINNYRDTEISPGVKTVVAIRLHHTMGDGYSIIYAVIQGAIKTPLSSIQLPEPVYVQRSPLSQLWFSMTLPFRLIYDISHYTFKGFRNHPWNVPDSKKCWHQYYARTRPVPIDKIKEIKNRMRVSFTSVILAAISSAMSKATGANAKLSSEKVDGAPFFIPLPRRDHPNAMKNHNTGAQIDLPMEHFSDPTKRVRVCEALLQQQKQSTIPWFLSVMGGCVGQLPSTLCSQAGLNRVNVSGWTGFYAGSKNLIVGIRDSSIASVELLVGGITGVAGVVFSSISYGKMMRFGVTAEASLLKKPDVDALGQLIVDEIDLLYDIVVATR